MSTKDDPPFVFPEAGCSGGIKVPTDREKAALQILRRIKDEVRRLKARRQTLMDKPDQGAREALARIEEDLSSLREQWHRWEEERKEAARERMILLGHEEP